MDVTCRACAYPAAIPIDTGHIVEQGRLARGFTYLNLDIASFTIARDERYLYHFQLRKKFDFYNQRACKRTGSLVIPRTRLEKRRSGSPVTSTFEKRL